MKLSLILPVYNVEQYLSRCIDSCLEQDLPQDEYEIIIVNDGSTDSSEKIARDYAIKHKSIQIITQPNKGLSSARNTGLKCAKGDYIWFIDSDDYIKKNSLKNIYNELSKYKLDAIWIKWNNQNEQNQIIPLYNDTYTNEDYGIYNGLNFMDYVMGIYYFAWSFIFKKEFLIKNKLYFKDGLYFEDSEFAYRALPSMQNIKLYEKECYNYCIRHGSIAQTISKKKINDLLYVAERAILAQKQFNNRECFLKSATNIITTALFHSISINYTEGINLSLIHI